MKIPLITFITVLLFSTTGVFAELHDRGVGLIYDDVLNITWLQDTNYAKTSGYDDDGSMNWYDSMEWVDQLEYGGYDDWRLPTTAGGAGYNITGGEMGYLYYVTLENLGYTAPDGTVPQPGWGFNNTGPFLNSQTGLFDDYWSSTENSLDPTSAWNFRLGYGRQHLSYKSFDDYRYAWAVRDGDVVPHTHCVGSSEELQDALNVAATNSTPDIIRIRSSEVPYVGNFVYASTESYGLTIEGGYNSDCSARVYPANTVLDGDRIGIVLLLSAPDDPAKFIVEGITFQNGYPQPSLQVITKYGEVTLNNNNISNNPRGGVYLYKIDKVTLNNNNISNNNYGGGIHLEDINTVTLNENIINYNDCIGGHVPYCGGIFGDSAGDVSLTNNTITNNSDSGVHLRNSGIVTFTNNNISNNISEFSTGGVHVRSATEVNLVNNIINNNISTTGGGGGAAITTLGTVILTNNLISDNSSQGGGGGGGADLNAGTAILTNNTIINNSTSQSGSGICLIAYTAILTNNTISNNSAQNNAASDGGGVRLAVRPDGIANIYNNIIWNNSAESIGADLYINNDTDGDGFANGTVNLYNNDFDLSNGFYIKVDDDSVFYSDNLNNVDPQFDIDGYHLTKDSPCINAGVDAGVYDDIDGDTRPQGTGYDIGADEYVTSDSDGDGIPDDDDNCPDSNLSDTVVIDGCDSGVENVLLADGCTISDLISECANEADNHGEFVSAVSHTTNTLKKEGIISGREKGKIQRCAAKADMP